MDIYDIYLNDKLVASIPSEDEKDVIKAVEKVFEDNIEYTSFRIYKNMRILKEVKRWKFQQL